MNAPSRLVRVNEKGYPVGEDHHRAKLTDADVDLVLACIADGMSYRMIVEKFEGLVSLAYVSCIANGKYRSQLITNTVRRAGRWREPQFMPADLNEFDIVGGY